MKRILLLLSLILVSLLIVSSATACSGTKTGTPDEPVVLRFTTGGPAEHPGTKLIEEFAEDFNARAGGGYIIKVFPGGTLVSTLEQNNAIRTGAVEMGDAATNFYAGDDAAFGVMDVPFLLNNYDAQIAFSKDAIDVLDPIAQDKFNQKIIVTGIYGTKDVYSVDKAVKTLDDWKGLLVSINTPIESDMVKALGGAPVLVDWIDELPSLQKGVINAGIISSPIGLGPMGYSDVINYYTIASMKGGMQFFSMNLDVWDSLPKSIQNTMEDAAWDYADNFNETFKNTEKQTIEQLKSEGVEVYYLPKDEHARWVAATQQVTDDYWNSLPQDITKKFKDFAESANSKYPIE
ncbi:MAG: TRAP transporter substrate-binding protein [Dehalococcoidia bacterium]